MVFSTVVGGGVTLGEVVRLPLSGVTAQKLDVDLIQVVRHQEERRDDTGTVGGLQQNFYSTEHDVEVGLDGWVVVALSKRQLQAFLCVCDSGLGSGDLEI